MSPSLGNGHQPMWGIANQVPNRGSIGVAHTVNNHDGIARAATEIFTRAIELADSRPLERGYESALRRVAPEALTRTALAALETAPGLDTEERDAESLRHRLALMKELSARTSSTRTQEVRRLVSQVVRDDVDKLLDSVRQSFDVNPVATSGVIRDIQANLAEMQWPQPTNSHTKKLVRITATIAELPGHEERLLPETLQRVIQDQSQAGWEAAAAALHEVVQSLVADEWQRQWPQLQASLQDVSHRCIGYEQAARQVHEALDENERMLREDQQSKASSVAMMLPGPTADEVVNGMKTVNHCADTPALANKMFAEFDVRLRQLARETHTHLDADGASLASLLLDLPVKDTTTEWLRLFDEHLGHGHSLYARVGAMGTETVTEFLWKRAAPTCFFLGRDHERFGMNITEVAIVRLPPTVGAEDPRIREHVASLFRGYSRNCHITTGAVDDREINVCRINCGFVIGIESANHSLIQRYGEAAEHGHLPHLAGIVADSPLGGPSSAYLSLLDSPPHGDSLPPQVAKENDDAPTAEF